jgi:hypothetical protein
MNTFNRFFFQTYRNMRPMALLSLAAVLASGCTTVERPLSNDDPDAWATRIKTLPIDVHSAIPGDISPQTIADAGHGVTARPGAAINNTGVSLYATARVVVYIGGGSVPTRDQYCALKPTINSATFVPESGVAVRAALCDGPRPVAYARMTLAEANPSPATVADAIERLKSDLVQSLPTPAPPPPEY